MRDGLERRGSRRHRTVRAFLAVRMRRSADPAQASAQGVPGEIYFPEISPKPPTTAPHLRSIRAETGAPRRSCEGYGRAFRVFPASWALVSSWEPVHPAHTRSVGRASVHPVFPR